MSSRNGADTGIVNMFKVNSSNQIEVGAPLIIGPLEFAEDSGLVSFLDMPVTSSATLGTPEGYTIKIDGNNLFTLYSESNGAGGVQNMRLGVGTTNPTGDLTIGGTGTRSISRDRSTGNLDLYGGSTYTDGAYFKVTGSTLNTSPGNSSGEFTIGEYTGTYASTFKINSFNGSTWTPRFLVMGSTGNVGIGVTNPIEMLHVGGTAQFDDVAMGVTPGSTQSLALTTVEYVNNMVTGVSTSTVGYWSANGTNIYNANSGNVGIGTSSPEDRLDIGIGGIRISNSTGAGAGINFRQFSGSSLDVGSIFPSSGYSLNIKSNRVSGYITLNTFTTGEVVRITDSGNVGIGTTNPGDKLDITGGNLRFSSVGRGLRFMPISGDYNMIRNYASEYEDLTFDTRYPLVFTTVTTGAFEFITNTGLSRFAVRGSDGQAYFIGNVGIGKTNPVYQLDVAGTANFDGLATGVTPGTTQKLAFTTVEYVDGMISGVSTSTVGYWSANGTNIYNANSGNVGIGTTAPWSKTTIRGVSSAPSLVRGAPSIFSVSATNGVEFAFTTAAAWPWTASIQVRDIPEGTSDAAYPLALNPLGGNIGIGTSAPVAQLDIAGSASVTNQIRLSGAYNTVGQGSELFLRETTAADYGFKIGYESSANRLYINSIISSSVSERLSILRDSGNVGINTTNPSRTLHVNGDLQLDAISFGVTPGESQTLALTTVEYVNAKVGGSAGITTGTTGQTLRHDGTGWVANSVLYNNGTNIGIGTTNPGRKVSILDSYDNSIVEPNSDPSGLIVQNLGNGSHTVTNFHTSIALKTFDDSWHIRATEIANNNLDLSFGHQYSTEATFNEKLRITSAGNVGIGISNPGAELEIQSSISGADPAVIRLSSGHASYYTDIANNYNSSESFYIRHAGYNIIKSSQNAFGAITLGNSNSILVISPQSSLAYFTGNLGIATTNPTQKLHVNGGAQLDSVSFGVTPGTTQKLALATVEYIDNMISGVSTSTVGYWSANGNHIYNANSANVGIGSSAPANKLDISGSLGIDGILKGYGSANGNFFEGKLGVNSLSAGASSLAVFGNAAIGTSYLSTSAPINGLIVQGNVGIATSTPAEALHIVGNLRVDGGATISGNLNMSGSTLIVNKITANTIDPLYTIGGVKYSTFAPSIVGGVKEEYVGRIYEDDFRKVGVEYEAVIDMSKLEEGSDLWVWHKVVDFSSDNVSVFLTPKGERASMYADIEGDKIVIRSDRVVDAYLRLIGSRYDWHEWPTKASDQNQPGGLLIN
jgi:hypothetical protein